MYMDDSMQFDVCSVSNPLSDTPPPFHVELSHGRVGGSTPIWAVGHPSGREKLSREKRRRERSVSNGFLFLQIVYFRREVTLVSDRTAATYVTYESWLNPLYPPCYCQHTFYCSISPAPKPVTDCNQILTANS